MTGEAARRPQSLCGLDPVPAAHVSTALVRYGRWLQHVDRPAPPGFDELLAAVTRVARNGQLRRTAGILDDDAACAPVSSSQSPRPRSRPGFPHERCAS